MVYGRKRMTFDIGKVDLDQGLKLENYIHDIEKDSYYFFKTGGPHYFSKTKIDSGIYKQLIWPFIIKLNSKNTSRTIQYGYIDKSGYPTLRINKLDGKVQKFRAKQNKYKTAKLQFWNPMHRIVAFVCVKNDNPDLKVIVNHINGNKLDYRPENLEWTTNRENSKEGSKGNKINVDELYMHLSRKEWFKNV